MSDETPKGWTVEVRLLEISTGARKTIVADENEGSTDIILKLAMIEARFELDGVKYWGGKPTVDPIRRVVTYYCEGYRDS